MPTKSPRTRQARGTTSAQQRASAERAATTSAPTPEPTPAPTAETAPPKTAPAGGDHGRTATVNLPFVTAQFRVPEFHLPGITGGDMTAAAQTARSFLPPPRQMLYYGGLALMAVFDVIEWPVAAAIGIGAAIVGRGGESEHPAPRPRQSPETHSAH
ncbi:hypothetical protein ORV05_11310 [Amycolatopsis cynarae]|uniref:Uncharacterized protein n=1 Tax=Amycolatopsis cynarae TaxID=2995223 RepID=A0ABY7B7L1_9PSEU|nr:hypothetical protein [Amycolatopsis sp. HUAS 11-8]WAL68320.1 hypothetical protein ORV05_11310 [Amycolatopsis sp. HUAS 11-8]